MSRIYSQIEVLINKAIQNLIATDPANARYLEGLNDSLIAIHCLMPPIELALTVQESALSVSILEEAQKPQLKVTGTGLSLFKLLTVPIENAATLKQSGIEITGDVGLLIEISQVAEKIDIDWEQLLSEKIGETPAVLLSRALKTGLNEAHKAAKDVSEFAQQKLIETDRFPTKKEAEEARKEIRELNYRLDRIEASRSRRQIAEKRSEL